MKTKNIAIVILAVIAALAALAAFAGAQTTEYLFTKKVTDGSSVTFGADFLSADESGILWISEDGLSRRSLGQLISDGGWTIPANSITTESLTIGGNTITIGEGNSLQFPSAAEDRTWSLPDVSGTLLVSGLSFDIDAGQIATGEIESSRLASSPAAGRYLSTLSETGAAHWTTLNASHIAQGTVAVARLGSGTPTSATVLRGDGVWSGINAGSMITSGTVPPARLGSGTANVSTVLLGNNTWGGIAGSMITSGTIAAARLGSGTANNTTFLRGDGTWQTPAGGGASNLVRGAATANGEYTLPETAPVVTLSFNSDFTEWTVQINDNAATSTWTGSVSDPADGSFWIDTSVAAAASDVSAALAAAMQGIGISAELVGEHVKVTSTVAGSGSSLITTTSGHMTNTYVAGTDETLVSASGNQVVLNGVSGKRIRMVNGWVTHNGVGNWELMDGTSQVIASGGSPIERGSLPLTSTGMTQVLTGTNLSHGYSLESTGQTTVWMIAEQY